MQSEASKAPSQNFSKDPAEAFKENLNELKLVMITEFCSR